MKLLARLSRWYDALFDPMRPPVPSRPCPTLASQGLPAPTLAPAETVQVSLAAFKRIRLEG